MLCYITPAVAGAVWETVYDGMPTDAFCIWSTFMQSMPCELLNRTCRKALAWDLRPMSSCGERIRLLCVPALGSRRTALLAERADLFSIYAA